MSIETRNVYFRRNDQYIYKNVGLLRQLTITKPKACRTFELRINGISIHPTEEDSKTAKWDLAEVRHRISENFDNNQLIKLHETFVYQSIQALPHYRNVPQDEFSKTLFTKDLQIQVIPPNSTRLVEWFEASEEVFKSDISSGQVSQN